MGLEDINADNFMSRPEAEDNNQGAYDEDNEEDSDDDLNIF